MQHSEWRIYSRNARIYVCVDNALGMCQAGLGMSRFTGGARLCTSTQAMSDLDLSSYIIKWREARRRKRYDMHLVLLILVVHIIRWTVCM